MLLNIKEGVTFKKERKEQGVGRYQPNCIFMRFM